MKILAMLMVLAGAPTPADDTICGQRDIILSVFGDIYGTWQVTSRHRQQNSVVEVLRAVRTQTWAVMGDNAKGTHCITILRSKRFPGLTPIS